MTYPSDHKLQARLAIEALRNGVPNREAVRELGCNQQQAEVRFNGMLDAAANASDQPAGHRGMLVSGDFGSGKSHLLAHLEHLALSKNFVCSKVAVSKETPLYDLGKVFASAMENGRIPDRRGRFIEELVLSMDPKSEEYEAFAHWTDLRRIERPAEHDLSSKQSRARAFARSGTEQRDRVLLGR